MKFNRGFSIFILLFFILPTFIYAVLCPTVEEKIIKNLDHFKFIRTVVYKECKACVEFSCPYATLRSGCPADFYFQCSEYSPEIDFIKSKSPNRMGYVNERITYISGCGGERNGTKCIEDQVQSFRKEIEAKKASGEYKKGEVYWSVGNSSNQNGAFKFIGIIIFGWILSVAAWIY